MNLRPYQHRAIDDLRAAYRAGARAPLLVAPTGAGKTVILAAIAAGAIARDRQVLILVHRRELIRQASQKLCAAHVHHGILAAGFPTSPAQVQLASVQTLSRRLEWLNFNPSLIIIDEAHHAVSRTWAQLLRKWPSAYRLGVTATPCRLDGRGLSAAFDALVEGPSVQMLTSAGYLAPSRIFAPPMVADLKGIKRRGGDYAVGEASAAMDRPTVTGDAIDHYKRLAGAQQAIAFCCSIAHAESVAASFNAAGISAATLIGSHRPQLRDETVASFARGDLQVLVTVDVVSEGFDIPAAGCAILLRPTQSLSLYMQQVGRVLRPAPGKDAAIILDHVGNVSRHGFPDDHRDWSLADGIKRNTNGPAAPSVRTCPSCYAAFKPQPVCPICGIDCAPKAKRGIAQVDGELQELTRDANGIELRPGARVRVAAYPGRYFWFHGIVADAGGDLVQVFKRDSDRLSFIGRTLNDQEVAALQKQNNDPLRVFNVFRGMVQRGGGNTGINAAAKQQQGRARTLPELLALAKERGYSRGWAYKVHASRGKR